MALDTAIHRLVARCRVDDHPALVARLASGWVVLGERQVFPGYCLLVPDPVVGHLNELVATAREGFLSDMALVGDAIMAVTAAVRINYAIFGNVDPALHAHIFPRFADEPHATRGAQPWAFDWSAAPEFSPPLFGDLKSRLADRLGDAAVIR